MSGALKRDHFFVVVRFLAAFFVVVFLAAFFLVDFFATFFLAAFFKAEGLVLEPFLVFFFFLCLGSSVSGMASGFSSGSSGFSGFFFAEALAARRSSKEWS